MHLVGFSNIVNWLSGERSEPKVDFSQSKHYWRVRSMARKPGAKFQQDRSSRSIVMAKKPLCLFLPIYIYMCVSSCGQMKTRARALKI